MRSQTCQMRIQFTFRSPNINLTAHRRSSKRLDFEQPYPTLMCRLRLVLIKSKLDQLKTAQPLVPFPFSNQPRSGRIVQRQSAFFSSLLHFVVPEHEDLTPKELVERYKLNQSHLAFTICKKLSEDSFELHHDTTVLSTVITEETNPSMGLKKKTTRQL
jgi:hypothetical protein